MIVPWHTVPALLAKCIALVLPLAGCVGSVIIPPEFLARTPVDPPASVPQPKFGNVPGRPVFPGTPPDNPVNGHGPESGKPPGNVTVCANTFRHAREAFDLYDSDFARVADQHSIPGYQLKFELNTAESSLNAVLSEGQCGSLDHVRISASSDLALLCMAGGDQTCAERNLKVAAAIAARSGEEWSASQLLDVVMACSDGENSEPFPELAKALLLLVAHAPDVANQFLRDIGGTSSCPKMKDYIRRMLADPSPPKVS